MTRNKKTLIILFGIMVVAICFRIFSLASLPPGLYPDEAMNGSNALETIQTHTAKVFYPENNGREGLFINIQSSFLEFFLRFSEFPEPWMLHIPSALFGIGTVLGMYFLTKKLVGKEKITIALLATFFLATSFWHINFSRIGFRAIMAPFFLVWGVFFLLFVFRKYEEQIKNIPIRLSYWLYPLAAGLVYGLGMHSYIAYRATPLLILVILGCMIPKFGWKTVFKIGFLFIVGSLLAALPLVFYFAQNPQDFLGRTTQVSIFSSASPLLVLLTNSLKTLGMFFAFGDTNWRHNLSGNAQLFFPIAFCFGITLLLGIKKIFQKKSSDRSLYIILFAWFAAAAAPVVVSNEGIPHALRAILMIPPAYILAAIGAANIYTFLQKKQIHQKILFAFSFLFLMTILFNGYYSYFVLWGENTNTRGAFAYDYVHIAKKINIIPPAIPKYIVVYAGGTDVRGYPMSTQTTMFLTKSFLPEEREKRNIHYITPDRINEIPPQAVVFEIR